MGSVPFGVVRMFWNFTEAIVVNIVSIMNGKFCGRHLFPHIHKRWQGARRRSHTREP